MGEANVRLRGGVRTHNTVGVYRGSGMWGLVNFVTIIFILFIFSLLLLLLLLILEGVEAETYC